ncbi:DNA polymerase II large subunit [Candidatus Woesearchaeota archaeon]|nr:DNA polymerase II large subunit [Candidatus Woesearchaeota archaeon]
MVAASIQMQKYFDNISEELELCYSIANTARKLNLDPEQKVDIRLARNMAERVEALIGVVAPQLIGSGVTDKIIEMEKKYAPLDWRVALLIAHEVAKQKFCKFKDQKEAIEVGIRTGFAYQTGGIVAAPLEGFIELKIKRTNDGKEYLAPFYAGPIRGAGGTAAAFSLLLVDFLRIKFGYAKYDPSPAEMSRFRTEIFDYNERVTNLQYLPSADEIDFLTKNLPIEVEGDPTEKIEVSNYKDLPRIETNMIRGGMCLVLAEGLSQKAPKLWKRLEQWGKEFGFEWEFLGEFIKLQKQIKAKKAVSQEKKEKLSPNFTFIADLVAGRPVLTHPMAKGGFRLRYGRTRTSGFSAASINPATMILLKKYIAVGTQLKIERPGKAAAMTVTDSIEGPVVKLKDGSVQRVDNVEQAKKAMLDVETILFLGDILINYGDFSENGHVLVPCGYNEEWWVRDVEKKCVELFGTIDIDKLSSLLGLESEEIEAIMKNPLFTRVSAATTLLISKKLNVPLHPFYTFHWNHITHDELKFLLDYWKNPHFTKEQKENDEIIKIVVKHDDAIKKIFEFIGCPHQFVNKEFIVFNKQYGLILNSLLPDNININTRVETIQPTITSHIITSHTFEIDKNKSIIENLTLLSGIILKDKSGTFIGARMGRPEKAKMRKMTGSPQVLFPVGEEGGKTRSFQSALESEKVTADFPIFMCPKCEKETIYKVCETCKNQTKQLYFCKACGKTDKQKCPSCKNEDMFKHQRQTIDIKHYFDSALSIFGEKTYPDLIKGVKGTSNKNHIPEHLVKGMLRAKHNLYVNKDGTIRYDMSELPITHFKPAEVGSDINRLKELGYDKDIYGKELVDPDQVLELKPQDLILPGGAEAMEEPATKILFRTGNFIDELLIKYYSTKPYYNFKTESDLVGHLVIALAPHISAGMVARIVGFSKTQGMFAHPLFHASLRRDCDGDEASVSLLLDGLLNFSTQFLPDSRGAKTMDAPLVLTSLLNPAEVDDQVHGLDVTWQYPLELYEAAEQYKNPWDVKIEQIKHRLGQETQYEQVGYTHPVSSINDGVLFSAYKSLPSMEEKLNGQMEIARMVRAVDEANVAELVITKHFIKDTKGNLRKFSQQQFRCVKCNEKFRRPPLRGICTKCGGKLIFTISEGSVLKYLDLSIKLSKDFNVSMYTRQTLDLLKNRIDSVFGKEKEKQEGLGKWF